MEYVNKEVLYSDYCPKCVNRDTAEADDPCDDCLAQPVNEHSHKPVYFSEDAKAKPQKASKTCTCKNPAGEISRS